MNHIKSCEPPATHILATCNLASRTASWGDVPIDKTHHSHAYGHTCPQNNLQHLIWPMNSSDLASMRIIAIAASSCYNDEYISGPKTKLPV